MAPRTPRLNLRPTLGKHIATIARTQSALNWIGLTIFVSAIVAYAYMSFNAKMKAKSKPFHIGGQAKVSSAAAKFKKSTEKTPLTA